MAMESALLMMLLGLSSESANAFGMNRLCRTVLEDTAIEPQHVVPDCAMEDLDALKLQAVSKQAAPVTPFGLS